MRGFGAAVFLIAVILVLAGGSDLRAEGKGALPVSLPPLGDDAAVLTISGPRGEKTYSLDRLEALGLHRITTETFWKGDEGDYEGPLLRDVLADAGIADQPAIDLVALDGYVARIPREDWQRWPVLLATRHAGQAISRRNKGPLRIIYPIEMDERLAARSMGVRWAWMIKSIAPAVP